MAIRIFITGGTFDKEYNEITGQLYFNDTHMHDLLEMGRSKVKVEIRTLMMIDSLEMTDEDRELIAYQCNQADEERIVITHGTDTMSDTAKMLAEKVKGKTIILTGAMIPIKFGSSDGLFNLGSALAFAGDGWLHDERHRCATACCIVTAAQRKPRFTKTCGPRGG